MWQKERRMYVYKNVGKGTSETAREKGVGSQAVCYETDTPNIDYLKEQVTVLKQLLDDPHPGLTTWVEMYGKRMQAISDFWNS